MPTTRRKVVSVDKGAARDAVASVGRKARSAASRKASAGGRAAKKKLQKTSEGAARTIAGRAADARRFVGTRIEERKKLAVKTALKTCVELSRRQLEALQKLERSIAEG